MKMSTKPSGQVVLEPPRNPLARAVLAFLHFYQRRISAMFGPRCRFYPSCSTYAIGAVSRHGAIKGTILAVWRLLRCNPLSNGGVDDVPETFRLTVHGYDSWADRESAAGPAAQARALKE